MDGESFSFKELNPPFGKRQRGVLELTMEEEEEEEQKGEEVLKM